MHTGPTIARSLAEQDLSDAHRYLRSYMDEFLSSYRVKGDRDDYILSERDKLLVEDAVFTLLGDHEFVAIASRLQVVRALNAPLDRNAF